SYADIFPIREITLYTREPLVGRKSVLSAEPICWTFHYPLSIINYQFNNNAQSGAGSLHHLKHNIQLVISCPQHL
ncbi:MAG: hypothetical protein ACI4Q8_04150, partial [Ruminococcus sp.]